MAGSDDLMSGIVDLSQSRQQYNDAWSFWDASRDEEFVSPAVKRALRLSEGRYQINVAKVVVRALANRLKIASTTALGLDALRDETVDEAFQAVLVANKMDLQWGRLIRNTLVYGDSYLFLWPQVVNGIEIPGQVQIAYNSPQVARTIYSPENDIEVDYHIKSWTDSREVVHTNLYYPAPQGGEGGWCEKWILTKNSKPLDPTGWTRDPEFPDDIPIPPGAGLYHFRTDMPYGQPVHSDAWGPQDAINKISTTMTHTTEAAGFPQRWALSDPMAALTGDNGDSPDWDDDGDADIITEDDSRLRGGPGELSILAGIKATGQWTAAGADAFINPAEFYTRMVALTTSTPMRFMDQRGQSPSGESLRVADAPLMDNVDNLQPYLDGEARAAMTGVLTLAGYPDHRADVRWKPTGIIDDLTTWQLVQAKIANGVPVDVALVETGLYEQDEVDSWLDRHSAEMDIGRRVGLLAQAGVAIQGLSAAVAAGVLTEQQLQAVIVGTLGELTPDFTGESDDTDGGEA